MVDMRSQNKGAAGCPKRSERVAGWLAVWLVEGCWLSVLMVEEGGGGGLILKVARGGQL